MIPDNFIDIRDIVKGYPIINTAWTVDSINNMFAINAKNYSTIMEHKVWKYYPWVDEFVKDLTNTVLIDAWNRPFPMNFLEMKLSNVNDLYKCYTNITTVDGWDVRFIVRVHYHPKI